jgi:lipopolysaccharide export system protein LptA
VKFRPIEKQAGGATPEKPRQMTDEVQRAVQQGHVTMVRRAPAKVSAKYGGPAKSAEPLDAKAGAQFDEEHATAERAIYDGDSDRLTLTGSVQMTGGQTMNQASVLWANQVDFERTTGDAQAEGSVKAIYQQQAGQQQAGQQRAGAAAGGSVVNPAEPAHILADHADLKHEANTATFYGRAGKPVRLWQGSSQVEAPVIEMSRDNLGDQRLSAHGLDQGSRTPWSVDGDGPVAAAPVHAVLVTAGSNGTGSNGTGPGKPRATSPGAAKPGKAVSNDGVAAQAPQVIRIASRQLMYSDLMRQADFSGGVRVDSKDGVLRGRQATAYLKNSGVETWGLELPEEESAGAATARTAEGFPSGAGSDHFGSADPAAAGLTSFSGSVERVIATGHIEIEQPGWHATGDRLVYTASDGWSVLTGDPTELPRLVDATRGTFTGASLRFRAGDDDVLVSNALPGSDKGVPGQRVHSETRVHPNEAKKPEGLKH